MKLEFLGCSTRKINQFNKGNIYTAEDLLKRLPKRYLDFRNPKTVDELKEGDTVAIILKILDKRFYQKKVDMTVLKCHDRKRKEMDIIYYNCSYLYQEFSIGKEYIFCGKVGINDFNNHRTFIITNPIAYSDDIQELCKIIPVYKKMTGMSDSYYKEKVLTAVQAISKDDYLEPMLINKYKLINEYNAISKIHMPENTDDIQQAQKRILFDDLFYYNYMVMRTGNIENNKSNYRFAHYAKVNRFLEELPFKLTKGQSDVLNDIALTTRKKERVDAVIMGDVGCGKTLIAELAMLMAHDEGYQSVLLAPTVVLANQHYEDIKSKMRSLNVNCALLTSQTPAKEKKIILNKLENGQIDMLIGTHSVLNPEIKYNNLALTVIDEEHKFGVKQRDVFKMMAKNGVHNISMSATPIPRTLALSLYGRDVKVYKIDSMPNGRKPIATLYKKSDESAFEGIKTQLDKGRQAYIVCALIESGDEKMSEVKSSTEMYEHAKKYFGPLGYKVRHINAKMKQDEINRIIADFSEKQFDILVSTTIIEVGVNIPNATVIYIANAERFGLAQLHQLRGRVGRGNKQGYCLLGGNNLTDNGKEKIKIMCSTNNGFEIAKKDLQLRGCGDFIGTVQSGENKYISLLMANEKMNHEIFNDIKKIFSDKKRMEWYEERMIDLYEHENQKNKSVGLNY